MEVDLDAGVEAVEEVDEVAVVDVDGEPNNIDL